MFMCWIDLELCTGDGCKTWPTKGVGPPSNISSWASWSVKQRLVLLSFFFMQIFNIKSHFIKIGLGIRTVYMFMCWMDLELCTGDGCKTWPTRGLVHPAISLPELLDLWSKDWSYPHFFFQANIQQWIAVHQKGFRNPECLHVHAILSFVQEMGVRPDLQRGWSTQQYLFLSFLIC